MSAHHLPPWLQRDREGAGAGPDYQRISVLGRTIIDRKTVEHTIRVFAQVGGCVSTGPREGAAAPTFSLAQSSATTTTRELPCGVKCYRVAGAAAV